ncbi:MAG TPA: hypothetical protein PLK35_03940 [Candidatus Moranbacteria bacterium]|nr:hypothetical protein [Candidatus Moranbacteria bacterium]
MKELGFKGPAFIVKTEDKNKEKKVFSVLVLDFFWTLLFSVVDSVEKMGELANRKVDLKEIRNWIKKESNLLEEIVEKIVRTIKNDRSYFARVVILLLLNIGVATWLVQEKILVASVSYNYAYGEERENIIKKYSEINVEARDLIAIDKKEEIKKEKEEEYKPKEKAEKINAFILTADEECDENVSSRKCSERCGKDPYDESLVEVKKVYRKSITRPRINARRPIGEVKKDGAGRLVCAKKNDKPKKSKQNKKGHMDMECCLDPDEIPNPHCYYSSNRYTKYLSKK